MNHHQFRLMFWNAAKEFVDTVYEKIASDEIKTDCIFKSFSQVLDDDKIRKQFIKGSQDNSIPFSIPGNPPHEGEKE